MKSNRARARARARSPRAMAFIFKVAAANPNSVAGTNVQCNGNSNQRCAITRAVRLHNTGTNRAAFAPNRLHGLKVGQWNLQVKMSDRAINYRTSLAGMLVGQPHWLERIFDTVVELTTF